MAELTTQTTLLDGTALSKERLALVAATLRDIKNSSLKNAQRPPKLVVVLVGDNAASQVYVNKKAKTAVEIGMASDIKRYAADVDENELRRELLRLNADDSVHAILIQLPLPKHLDTLSILSLVSPEKDVDGLHPVNLGRLMTGQKPFATPCTPTGIMTMLHHYNIPISGQHAVIVGRSTIVGKPMGMLLLAEHATVSYCHSKTKNLRQMTQSADIIIAAAGVPRLITAHDITPNTVVIDVGINRLPETDPVRPGKLCGDVDFDSVAPLTSHITPVPGGVGPMTIATLMENTLSLYRQQGHS